MSKFTNQDDLVAAGFERLDPKAISQHPPKIRFGELYRKMGLREKVRYCERLASTMNHAAATIQKERDQLNDLLHMKEMQLKAGGAAMGQNNSMIQDQITKHNAEKQALQQAVAEKNARIRELEKQLGVESTV